MAIAVSAVAALVASVTAQTDATEERFWPQWRGPYATGVSRRANPPTEWSETKNIRWKVEIPGRGSGSPVVWGDRLFLLSALPVGVEGPASHESRASVLPRDVHRFIVMAIDRRTGRVVWERTAREERPHEPSMKDGTWASSSAITDGQRVFAFFESSGLYAYDMDGTLIWQKQFGEKKMFADVGESGSTPVLYDNRLIIVWDHQGTAFIVALDAPTGQGVWRASRTGSRLLGDPTRGGSRRSRAGRHGGAEPTPQLRSRNGPDCLGERRADDEPDSLAGGRRWDRGCHERLPRQRSQGDSSG